jgi:hypothetical protein
LTKNDILTELYKSPFINDLVFTITSGHELKEDLKAELFLILCEMTETRVVNAYNGNFLHYLCVNIVKKQYNSKKSPFHQKWRKGGITQFSGSQTTSRAELPELYTENLQLHTELVVEKVLWFVENKLDLVDRELFKIYYKFGDYDRYFGELRDQTCKKPISSLRKVERKLAITTIDGGYISIGYDTIRLSLNRSLMRIKYYLKENELLD